MLFMEMARLLLLVGSSVVLMAEGICGSRDRTLDDMVTIGGDTKVAIGKTCEIRYDYKDSQFWSFFSTRGGKKCYKEESKKYDNDAVEIWLYLSSKYQQSLVPVGKKLPTGNFGDREANAHLPGDVWVGAWKVKLWADSMAEYYYSTHDFMDKPPLQIGMEYKMGYATSCTTVPDQMAKIGIWNEETMRGPTQWSQCGEPSPACYKDTCMKRDQGYEPRKGPWFHNATDHPGGKSELHDCSGERACWFAIPDNQINLEVIERVPPQWYSAGADVEKFMHDLHDVNEEWLQPKVLEEATNDSAAYAAWMSSHANPSPTNNSNWYNHGYD